MNRVIRLVATRAVSAVVMLGAVVACADIPGSISGFVFDPSGAVVPGAILEVTSVATNQKRTTTADSKGSYSFPALSVGVYNMAIAKSGFRDIREDGITIDPKSSFRITNIVPVASEGPALFARNCGACHGVDGRGGDRAPDIATVADVQQLSDADLIGIIRNGISNAGMPGFGSLGAEKLRALVDQLRLLQGKSAAVQLSGNAHAGELLFFGKAQCSACHTVNGKGGFIASDLSLYGSHQVAGNIRRVIIDPNNNLTARSHATTVVTNTEKKITGIVKSSDNFSITLQTLDGSFRFFKKADLKRIDIASSALMPDNYGSVLNADELSDLISYLLSVASENAGHDGEKKEHRSNGDDWRSN